MATTLVNPSSLLASFFSLLVLCGRWRKRPWLPSAFEAKIKIVGFSGGPLQRELWIFSKPGVLLPFLPLCHRLRCFLFPLHLPALAVSRFKSLRFMNFSFFQRPSIPDTKRGCSDCCAYFSFLILSFRFFFLFFRRLFLIETRYRGKTTRTKRNEKPDFLITSASSNFNLDCRLVKNFANSCSPRRSSKRVVGIVATASDRRVVKE